MRADKPDSTADLGELRTGRPGITVTVWMPRLKLLSNVAKFCIALLEITTWPNKEKGVSDFWSIYFFIFGPITEKLEETLERRLSGIHTSGRTKYDGQVL